MDQEGLTTHHIPDPNPALYDIRFRVQPGGGETDRCPDMIHFLSGG